MSSFRLLYLATTGIGICLYSSLINNDRTNVFKVKAEPQFSNDNDTFQLWDTATYPNAGPLTSSPIKKSHTGPSQEFEIVNPINVTKCALKENKDFRVCYNSETGIPNWTLQHVTNESITKESEDNYNAKARQRTKMLEIAEKYHVFDLDPCIFQLAPAQTSHADRQSNSLWNDFYQYVNFLSKKHKNIYICSGPIRSYDPTTAVLCITHFFKVILGENENGTYRLECYIIKRGPMLTEHPELRNFNVKRRDLQTRLTFMLFPDVLSHMVRESQTERLFNPLQAQ